MYKSAIKYCKAHWFHERHRKQILRCPLDIPHFLLYKITTWCATHFFTKYNYNHKSRITVEIVLFSTEIWTPELWVRSIGALFLHHIEQYISFILVVCWMSNIWIYYYAHNNRYVHESNAAKPTDSKRLRKQILQRPLDIWHFFLLLQKKT